MNGLEFVSALVGHLAWPLLVLTAVLLFRKPIGALIARTKSYEGPVGTVTFGDQLAVAEDSVDHFAESVDVPVIHPMEVPSAESELPTRADTSPSYMIIKAWEDLAEATVELAKAARGPDSPGIKRTRTNPIGLVNDLAQGEVVNNHFVSAFRELRELRNRVAHGRHDPTQGEAVAYVESAVELARAAYILAEIETAQRRRRESGADE